MLVVTESTAKIILDPFGGGRLIGQKFQFDISSSFFNDLLVDCNIFWIGGTLALVLFLGNLAIVTVLDKLNKIAD